MLNSRVIILGAGRPSRGNEPSALLRASGNQRVLDWILDAFSKVVDAEFHFVGGYRYEAVLARYSDIRFSVNPHWEKTGSLGSLLTAPLVKGQVTFVSYSDIVFNSKMVRQLYEAHGDVVIAVDRKWRHRYHPRPEADLLAAEKVKLQGDKVLRMDVAMPLDEADAEYAGVMKLSPLAVDVLIKLRDSSEKELTSGGMPRLVRALQEAGLEVRAVESDGDWAELNEPQDLARFILGTKAETLARLRSLVKKSEIGDQVSFTIAEWISDRKGILQRIQEKFLGQKIVVRSSALSEDSWTSSNAGGFDSVLDVLSSDAGQVATAIERVVASYGDSNNGHQVLVQEMLRDVKVSGVVFTRTLNVGAPYYTINYDDSTSSTDTVTGGSGRDLRTLVVHRSVVDSLVLSEALSPETEPSAVGATHEVAAALDSAELAERAACRLHEQYPLIARLLVAVREVEELVGHDSLDIEFAITQDQAVHVLQVRPIAVDHGASSVPDEHVATALKNAIRRFAELQAPSPFVCGRRTFFGVMPDWNPAEIIGTNPRRLARSLYQYLITDEVWATQRAEYGYIDVRPHPLLVSFGDHPYIDVRASFTSFIPATLPKDLAERLADHYLDRLEKHPHLHDKVEFDIAFTCLSFDFEAQAARLRDEAGLTEAEIQCLRGGLAEITRRAIERCSEDLRRVEAFSKRFEALLQAPLSPMDRVFALLDDCRRLGTLHFAHLARGGFVAVTLLRSLERKGVTTPEQTAAFLNSLETVARAFENDGAAVASGSLAWDEFVRRYGHLRPGTYEITSPAYAADPERYLRPMVRPVRSEDQRAGREVWDARTRAAIAETLREAGLPDDVDRFERFLREAIQGREYSKFVFTRNLSAALELIAEFGAEIGLSRDDLSHISILDLLQIRTGSPAVDLAEWLKERSREGREWYKLCRAVELPPLLMDPVDFVCFERPTSHPNFITHGRVIGPIVDLASAPDGVDLKGKIVLIPAADPGYDWLFGHEIRGLITMYGGANSHMAIRAAEFGLPAAIGVGEKLYAEIAACEVIELDCAGNRITVVR